MAHSLTLPGGSGLSVTVAALDRAAADASELARDLVAAQYADEDKLEDCQHMLIRIGHALGMTFSHVKRFSGEVAIQRMDLAMQAAAKKQYADMATRALSARRWQERAEAAEATVREMMAERASHPHHLEAAE